MLRYRILNKIGIAKGTRGTETSNYPEEKKVNTIPKVVASEIGRAQTKYRNMYRVRTCTKRKNRLAEDIWKGITKRVKFP